MTSERPISDSGSKDIPADGSKERPVVGRELQPTIDAARQNVHSANTIEQPQGSATSNSNPSLAGKTHLTAPGDFGKYKLLKVLGQGGMGAVYMADDPTLDRKVALKIPLVDPQERSAILDRFKREAKAVAPLRHPSICPVFEVGEIDGRPYMTMAYIEGKPLSDYIDPKKPLPIKSALTMTAKIAAALDYAHKKGVIHRDLKPANIMIDERREPVIMDFGLARRSSHPQETKLTQAGSVMGTPAYMPPEQARGDAEQMGPASDIYSLGVILYEMLAGRVPFEGDIFSVMMKLATEPPPPLPSLRNTIDPAVDAICQKALAKSPQDRHASMADFGRVISAYLRGLSTTSAERPVSDLERLGGNTAMDSNSSGDTAAFDKTASVALNRIEVTPTTAMTNPTEQVASAKPNAERQPLGKNFKVLIGAIAVGLLLLLGVILIVRDNDGKEVARIDAADGTTVTLPAGGSVQVQQGGPTATPNTATANSPKKLFMHDPAFPQWAKDVQGMPAEKQIEAVGQKLMELNPGFDGKVTNSQAQGPPKIDNGVVTEFRFAADNVIDLSPVRALSGLKVLRCPGSVKAKGKFSDLSPLNGMRLTQLNCEYTNVSDLLPLVGMPLTSLNCAATQVSDLSALKGMSLTFLDCMFTEAADLSALHGMPLTEIKVTATNVSDLSPLAACTSLKALHAKKIKVTPAQFAALQKALPNCKIDWDDPAKSTIPVAAPSAPPILVAPFPESTAKASQEAWAKHLNRPVKEKNSISMEFMLIPPGEFMMGISDAEFDWARPQFTKLYDIEQTEGSRPQHKVRITKPFYLQTTEVTVGQFRKFIDATGYKTEGEKDGKGGYAGRKEGYVQHPEHVWNNPQFAPSADHPVVLVNWNDAMEFVKWLSKADGKFYRLPSEAQWEYCCRAGTETWWYHGSKESGLDDYAWYTANRSGNTAQPVGRKKPNAFGLFDLHGNAWEWCADWADKSYYARSPIDDPPGPNNGSDRVFRGGNFFDDAEHLRSSRRGWFTPTLRHQYNGFRIVLDISKTAESASTANLTLDSTPATKSTSPQSSSPPMLVAPFPESTAKASQDSWAKHLNRPVKEKNFIGMEFVLIPPGEFMMGASQQDADTLIARDPNLTDLRDWLPKEVPSHKVRITKPFYMQTTEVTLGQFRKFIDATDYKTQGEKDGKGGYGPVPGEKGWKQRPEYIWSNAQYSPTDDHPVVFVSWNDASEFVKWLSKAEGKIYRLPTEAQWEYCCRSGTETWWYHGSKESGLEDYAWYTKNNTGSTQPIGRKKANAFGLFDMHGNVWEWCADWGDAEYYVRSPPDDPPGPNDGSARVIRGGDFDYGALSVRSGRRRWASPAERDRHRGFRLVLDISKAAE